MINGCLHEMSNVTAYACAKQLPGNLLTPYGRANPRHLQSACVADQTSSKKMQPLS